MSSAEESISTGTLEAIASTTGDSLDSDGYAVSVERGSSQAVGINDTATFADLSADNHRIELLNVTSNCAVSDANPRTVSVPQDDTASTTFSVSCEATDGGSGTVITGITFQDATHQRFASGSDNWAMTWADDGHQYTNWGDGGGFEGSNTDGRTLMGVARIEGSRDTYTGINVNGGVDPESHNTTWPTGGEWGKSRTMFFIDGTMYLFASRKSFGDDCGGTPCAYERQQLWKSTDYGDTWSQVNGTVWKYGDGETIGFHHFINMGQAHGAAIDDYVYVSAIEIQDTDATQIQAPGELMLMRVPANTTAIEDKKQYEYFSGSPENPAWSSNFADRTPALEDSEGFMRHSITLVPSLDRFLMLGPHTADDTGNLKVWEAPKPWGPWTLVQEWREDDGSEWTIGSEVPQWYFWDVAPKWISADDTSLVVVATGKQDNDSWNTVEATLSIQ